MQSRVCFVVVDARSPDCPVNDGEFEIEPDVVAEDPVTALQVVRFEEERLLK